jgi:1-acyl-sn-glycerol-3-phosphate acyltransferase
MSRSRPLAGLVDDVRVAARGWRWTHPRVAPRSVVEAGQVSARYSAGPRGPADFATGWARTPAAGAVRAALQGTVLRAVVDAEVHREVAGLATLDGLSPPVIFAANHASHLDTPLLLLALPPAWRRDTVVAAAADYFFATWWRAIGAALVFNAFPLERRSAAAGVAVARAAQRRQRARGDVGRHPAATGGPLGLLADGWNLLVYPEGTRSPDGWLGPIRPGAGYLAIAAGVPVVPVAVRGTFAAMPRGRGWPAPGRPVVRVRFGEPIQPAPGEGAREVAARITAALGMLLDEDRTTWWAARRRTAAGVTPPPAGPEQARWRRVWAATEPVPPGRADGRGSGGSPARDQVQPWVPTGAVAVEPRAASRATSREVSA